MKYERKQSNAEIIGKTVLYRVIGFFCALITIPMCYRFFEAKNYFDFMLTIIPCVGSVFIVLSPQKRLERHVIEEYLKHEKNKLVAPPWTVAIAFLFIGILFAITFHSLYIK